MWTKTLAAFLLSMLALPGATTPPIEDFTRFSEFESFELSPDGQRLAITRRSDAQELLVVLDVDTLEPISSSTFGERTHIEDVFWVNNDRLLVQPASRFPGTTDGYVPTGEILGINADGTGVKLLFGARAQRGRIGARSRSASELQFPGRVVDLLRDDDDHVIVQSYGWDLRGEFNRSFKLNVYSGRAKRLQRSPVRNGTFVTDTSGNIALVYGVADDGSLLVYAFDANGESRVLHDSNADNGLLIPLRAWPDPDQAGHPRFLVREQILGATTGLALWTPENGTLDSLARHPEVDLDTFLLDQNRRVYAVRFINHFPEWVYPDPEHPLATLHADLRAGSPGQDVLLYRVTNNSTRALAFLGGPRNPGLYVIVDVVGRKPMRRLAVRPWHSPESLSPQVPFELSARDGMILRGYLTEPAGAPGPRAMVVLVHGGPHGIHDDWGFNSRAQLLASRGYLVLQVNYRGSSGRGRDFEEAGHGAWGAEMQDDVADAVRWAVESGAADPDRICIMGGSYGAYAALTGAFRTPDLYRCAIGMAGVYDLELMFEKGDISTAMRGQAYLEQVLGDDKAALRARSPAHHADAISAAVLLAHGDLDERAPIEHAHRMRRALRKAGNPPVWIRRRREGHGFVEEDNRRDFNEQVLTFLDQHLNNADSGTRE